MILNCVNVYFSFCLVFKIDRLYDWKKSPDSDVALTLKKQKKNTKDEFEERAKAIIVEFAQQVSTVIIQSVIAGNLGHKPEQLRQFLLGRTLNLLLIAL